MGTLFDMSRLLTFLSAMVLAGLGVLACVSGNGSLQGNTSAETGQTNKKTTAMDPQKTLIVFFSHTGENYAVGNITEGNTRIIADMIADETGAKTFEIVPEKDYPFSYDECIAVARKELHDNCRPAVRNDIDLSGYDTIFLGYPNWWGQPPMCVFTFIEGHDWNGKKVIPFITHEGSGMGGTDRRIASSCKGADVAVGKGLAVRGATAQNDRETARKAVRKWLDQLSD